MVTLSRIQTSVTRMTLIDKNMIKRLLDFLDASPVNFLAVDNIAKILNKAGYREIDPRNPIGKVSIQPLFWWYEI